MNLLVFYSNPKINIQQLQSLRNGFRIESISLKNANAPSEIFYSSNDLFGGEMSIKKEILSCEEVSREIVFSSKEPIRNFRIEQELRLNDQIIEKHSFRFGFVIPGSTNSWEQTFTASTENRIADPTVLSGNLEILTSFCDGPRLIKRLSLIVYYV